MSGPAVSRIARLLFSLAPSVGMRGLDAPVGDGRSGECPASLAGRAAAIQCFFVHGIDETKRRPEAVDSFFVMRRRADEEHPDAPTIVFLPGGPGLAGTQELEFAEAALGDLLARHDLVLFDSYGTGRSSGARCQLYFDGTRRFAPRSVAACRDSLGPSSEASKYGSQALADDLELVRTRLGLSHVIIYGLSSGARAALLYGAAYPEHLSGLVLHSPLTLAPWLAQVPFATRRTVMRMQELCSVDRSCTLGDETLSKGIEMALDRLQVSPMVVHVRTSSRSGDTVVTITARGLALLLQEQLADPQARARFVRLLESTRQGGSRVALEIAVDDLREELARQNGIAVLSTLCENIRATPKETSLVDLSASWSRAFVLDLLAACSAWPRVGFTPRHPLKKVIPIIAMVGELDPITPAELVSSAGELSRAVVLIIRDAGHGLVWKCARDVVKEILATQRSSIDSRPYDAGMASGWSVGTRRSLSC